MYYTHYKYYYYTNNICFTGRYFVMAAVIRFITLNAIIGVVVTMAMIIPNRRTLQLILSINMAVVNMAIPINDKIAPLYVLASDDEAKLAMFVPKYVVMVMNTARIAL